MSGADIDVARRYPVPPLFRVIRATVYATLVFLSFFLMLIFMTYNVRNTFTITLTVILTRCAHAFQIQAYLIFAVVLGAGIGHYALGGVMDVDSVLGGSAADGKTMACH